MALKAFFLRLVAHATIGAFKWIDVRFVAWLSRRHWFWLWNILGSIVILDLAMATGTAIPGIGTVLASLDGMMLIADEALMIWPAARVSTELLRRLKSVMIAKGIQVPASLEKIEEVADERAERDVTQVERHVRRTMTA